MTKKQRTVLFVIISTLVSVLIMIGLLFLFLFLTFAFLDGEAAVIVSFISFIMAMFGGTIVHQKVMAWAIKKFRLEEKMEPLWGKKHP